jgi:hypothetical protein
MTSFVTDIRQTLVPDRDSRDGPLPPLLVAMTLVTGLVDAFSYLLLGHVFVANMTGNVVLLGFALVGAPGFSIAASLAAIASFALGALVGGKVGSCLAQNRGHLFVTAASIQAVFIASAVVLAAISGNSIPAGYRYSLIVLLAIAMGIQNAGARKLAVPDLTTTVLTLTITGIAADSRLAGGQGSKGAPSYRGGRDAGGSCHRSRARAQRRHRLSPRHRSARNLRRRNDKSDAGKVERTLAPRRTLTPHGHRLAVIRDGRADWLAGGRS